MFNSKKNTDWIDIENWDNNNLVFVDEIDALYFNSFSEYEEAICIVPIPKEAKSFSMSIKVGNDYRFHKIGYRDSGYITVGFDDNFVSNGHVRSAMISNRTEFVVLNLGTAAKPISIESASNLYIKAEAYNSGNNKIDFYFGELSVNFYEKEAVDSILNGCYFDQEYTNEKVCCGNKSILNTLILSTVIILIAVALFFKKENKRVAIKCEEDK